MATLDRGWKTYLCDYEHDGARWSIHLVAYDREDAEARVLKLADLRIAGELVATIPCRSALSSPLSLIITLGCWILNIIKPRRSQL
jgi:hypothetical protein